MQMEGLIELHDIFLIILCKRAKLRGTPKALVTKVFLETKLLASVISEGKVISLKIIKWVIADLSHIVLENSLGLVFKLKTKYPKLNR